MTEMYQWHEVNYGPDGRAHVRVTDPVVGTVTVIVPGYLVDTPEGEEVIRRALVARRAAHEVVRGERP